MVEGHESGNWLGPTILANVTMDMDVWHEEIFAPVLVCLEVGAAQRVERVTAPVWNDAMKCVTCCSADTSGLKASAAVWLCG